MIVYLWDAGRCCGVTGSLTAAQNAAATRMGDSAWVDEARPVYDNMQSLVRTYERTGRTWIARSGGPGDTVRWIASATQTGDATRADRDGGGDPMTGLIAASALVAGVWTVAAAWAVYADALIVREVLAGRFGTLVRAELLEDARGRGVTAHLVLRAAIADIACPWPVLWCLVRKGSQRLCARPTAKAVSRIATSARARRATSRGT